MVPDAQKIPRGGRKINKRHSRGLRPPSHSCKAIEPSRQAPRRSEACPDAESATSFGSMSDLPTIAAKAPIKVSLQAGKDYWFCACGKSASQPFCDGSHKSTSFGPKKFTAEKDGDSWLCQCKHTANAPFCDGTHKTV
ncbi:MAG TPA: CDGSH iron-sulfur domain-containing protein [Bryobacteraceae bacterium]